MILKNIREEDPY